MGFLRFLVRTRLAAGTFCALFLAAECFSAEHGFWQLQFTYTAQELKLVKATEIPASGKAVKSPGGEGALLKLEYEIQWVNEQGQVIYGSPVILPLGTRSALSEAGGPHDELIPSEGSFVVRVQGPSSDLKPVSIRLLRLAQQGGQNLPGLQPPEVFAEGGAHVFPLRDRGLEGLLAAAGPLSVSKVRHTGPDRNRLVIVVMCDGFTEGNLASGSFSNYVNSFLNYFFSVPPWSSYAQEVNVYRIDIASNESGADYADASPTNGGTTRDTYLNAAFWTGGTERCLFLNSQGTSRAFAAADDYVGAGLWDEILVFVNSTKYGGCGGSVGVSSLNASADEIQVHEFGHSFAGLADEYEGGSTSTNCTPSSTRNVDCGQLFPSVKWDAWVTPGAPIPTPETSAYANVIGAFQGASDRAIGTYRPKLNCKMRALGVPFCSICSETHIMRIFDRVTLADSTTPPTGPAEVPAGSTAQFLVTPVTVSGLQYQWELGGVPIAGGTNRVINISGSQVTSPNMELKVSIVHTTALVRAATFAESYQWTLNLVDTPALAVENIVRPEPLSASGGAAFDVTLSFTSAAPVTVEFFTSSGTATPNADYQSQSGLLTFAPGEVRQTVSVPVHADADAEIQEVFFLNLANATNARLADAQGTCVIRDNDNAPTVSILSPIGDAVFAEPAAIETLVQAHDADGSVAWLQLRAGETLIGETNGPRLSITWRDVPSGIYWLQAVAEDNTGRSATSAPVRVIVSPAVPSPISLVSLTQDWRYDASTSDYGTAWKDATFDDTAWLGPSPGAFYNESASIPAPKNTLLPLANPVRLRSYYFRTHFEMPPLAETFTLIASNLVDDGAVFYLNGAEVGRLRMTGTPTRTSLASGQPPDGGDATAFEPLIFPTANLVPGDNVLAVEVHQQSDSSSDVVFGMQLDAMFGFAPFLTDEAHPLDTVALQGRSHTMRVEAAGAPAPRYQWYRNDIAILNATNTTFSFPNITPFTAGLYHCIATNSYGAVTSRAAQITYVADEEAPTVVYAYGSTNPASIVVWFSETMNFPEANAISNYVVTPIGGGAPLTITRAFLSSGTNVTLTTSHRVPGTSYLLTVNNVRDRFTNSVAPNTQIPIAAEVLLVIGDHQPWHYLASDAAPDAGWTALGYQDPQPGWLAGEALFDAKSPGRTSVGGQPVRTPLLLTNPPSAPGITLAYYFRTHFTFPGPTSGARLYLRTLVDDGAVYYLNGREVFRLGMPLFPEPIEYNTLAARSQGDAQNIYEGPFELSTEALMEGDNVLGVEVHQTSLTSSDLSFTAQLIGRVSAPAFVPTLWISRVGDQVTVEWNVPTGVLESAPEITGPWAPVLPAPSNPAILPAEGPARFYRLAY